MRHAFLIFFVLSLCLSAPASQSLPFKAKIITVKDGDTYTAKRANGHVDTIRLHYADAPEKDQPFGAEATQFAEAHILGKQVTISPVSTSYGRIVADVAIANHDFAGEIVGAGLAQLDPRYKPPVNLRTDERAVQILRIGLWSQANPIPPWEWRKQNQAQGSPDANTTTNNLGEANHGHRDNCRCNSVRCCFVDVHSRQALRLRNCCFRCITLHGRR